MGNELYEQDEAFKEAFDQAYSPGLSHRVDVPGNHFTMMREHAGTTARAIEEWLATISENGSAGAVGPVVHERKV